MSKFFTKTLLLFCLLVGTMSQAFSQTICPTSISLTSQEEVDGFSCTIVNGNLNISGTDITDLSAIANLERVTGYIQITNTNVTNLDAFDKLQSIGSYLYIRSNPSLQNIDGFNALTQLGSYIDVTSNPALSTMNGFNELAQSGYWNIQNNDALIELNGFQKYTATTGHISIWQHLSLPTIALNELETIADYLYLGENDGVQTIAFPKLKSINSRYLLIRSSPALSSIDFSVLERISGYLHIGNNASLPTIDKFPVLNSIGSYIHIRSNGALQDLDGFNALTQLSSYIDITSNAALKTINGFNELPQSGYWNIQNNDALIELNGFQKYTATTGHISIWQHLSLPTIALNELETIADYLYLGENDGVETIAFPKLTGVNSRYLLIRSSPALNSINFPVLERISGYLHIGNNASLPTIDKFPVLNSIGGYIYIRSNGALQNLDGFNALTQLSSYIDITSNAALKTINGFNELTQSGYWNIQNNDALIELNGFQKYTATTGHISIWQHLSLPTIALNELETIADYLYLGENDGVETVAFPKLTGVNSRYLLIRSSPVLSSIDFPVLERISGYLHIGNNASLPTIDKFPVLNSIGGYIYIRSNAALQNLDGFNALTQLSSYIDITSNAALKTINGFNELTQSGYWNIQNNDVLDELNGFQKYTATTGHISIWQHLSLPTIALNELETIADYLYLGENDGVENIIFPKLTSINSRYLIVRSSPSLKAATFPVIERINGYLAVTNNPALERLSGFAPLTQIGGTMTIANNNNLRICCDLKAVLNATPGVVGAIVINNNPMPCSSESEIRVCENGDPCEGKGGDVDQDGVCAEDDCNDNDSNIGAKQPAGVACNDNDSMTENDQILADGCTCEGIKPANNEVFYVAERASFTSNNIGFLSRIDANGNRTKIADIPNADGVVLKDANTAIVSQFQNTGSNIVSVNLSTGEITDIAALGGWTQGLEIDRLGNIYAVNQNLGKIQRISQETGEVVDVLTGLDVAFNGPVDLLIENENSILVATIGGLFRVDLLTNTSEIFVTGLNRAVDIYQELDGNLLVAEFAGDRISRIDINTGERTTVANIAGSPHGITKDREGNILVTLFDNNQVVKVTPDGTVQEFAAGFTNPVFIVNETLILREPIVINDPCTDNGGDADNDGICINEDCNDNDPNIGAKLPEGTACNDNNPMTANDQILEDGCTCEGEIETPMYMDVCGLADGLAAFFPMDNNPNDVINGNQGTVNGATLTTDRFGNANSAYEFDGMDDFIDYGDSTEYRFAGDYSISLWVKPDTLPQFASILSKGNTNPPYNGYLISLDPDPYRPVANPVDFVSFFQRTDQDGIANTSDERIYNQSATLTTEWEHIVVTNSSNGPANLYLNNLLIGSSSTRLGTIEVIGSALTVGNKFKGKIDDIRLYQRFLSRDEVQDLYDCEKPEEEEIFYVTERNGIGNNLGFISKIDNNGNRTKIADIPNANGIILKDVNTAIVSQFQDAGVNLVSVDLTTGAITDIATLGGRVEGLELDTEGNIYVGNQIQNKIQRINIETGQVADILTDLDIPVDLLIENENSIIITEFTQGTLLRYNFSTNTSEILVSDLNGPTDIYQEADGNLLIAEYLGNTISRINITTRERTTVANIGGGPHGITKDDNGNILVTLQDNNEVKLISPDGTVSDFAASLSNPIFIVNEAIILRESIVINDPCTDTDEDGICDSEDNCLQTPNPNQLNADNDTAGAVCDCDDSPETGATCTDGCQYFYLDSDGDSFGNKTDSVLACTAPMSYVDNKMDCDDGDINKNIGNTCTDCTALPVLQTTQINSGSDSTFVLFDNDFENPVTTQFNRICSPDVTQMTVRELFGFDFNQTFTVETILINGSDNTYTDSEGRGGNYALGLLRGPANDDMLAFTFDKKNLPFINLMMDVSALDLTPGNCGAPFGVATPIFRISVYDSPSGTFTFGNAGTLLNSTEVTGIEPGVTPFTYNWATVMASLNVSAASADMVTIVVDLLQSGYASFDNIIITASNREGSVGDTINAKACETATLMGTLTSEETATLTASFGTITQNDTSWTWTSPELQTEDSQTVIITATNDCGMDEISFELVVEEDTTCAGLVPFDCSPDFYRVSNGQLQVFDTISNSYTSIGPDHPNINSIGYNIEDDLIYGQLTGNRSVLVRIDAEGTLEEMGIVQGLPNNTFSGDFDNQGNLYFLDNTNNRLLKVDVGADILRAENVGIQGNIPSLADISFDKVNNLFYGMPSGNGRLMKIDLNSKTISQIPVSGFGGSNNGFGASYFTSDGKFYTYQNSTFRIYEIDVNTGESKVVATIPNPNQSNIDGANCPDAISIFRDDSICNDELSTQTFTTQFQLDSFVCDCNKIIQGDLIINGDDINDLSNLSCIKEVTGNVLIGDSLSIPSNDILQTLDGLSGMMKIGGDLVICNNPALRNLDGFSSLMEVGGDIQVKNCQVIEYIRFVSLTSVGGSCIYINLSNLRYIGSAASGVFGGFGLTSFGGGVRYENLPLLEWITGFDGISEIRGDLYFINVPKLPNLEAYKRIIRLFGCLHLIQTTQIIDFSGLDSLELIGEDIRIMNNDQIRDLSQLGNLVTLNGSIIIMNNANLQDLNGLRNLLSVADTLKITGNPLLNNCCGINDLLRNNGVGGPVLISDNLAGCLSEADIDATCTDEDGDGFSTIDDCDDTNANINPEATEIACNGIDEDCDGEDLQDCPIVDNDEDGFSEAEGDCNDNNPDIYPGATEILCDGVDSNCNGEDECPPPPCTENGGDIDEDGVCADIDCNDNDASISKEGDLCDDGDAKTTDDKIDGNCECKGTPPPPCEIGTPCDDGNIATINDTLNLVDMVCTCEGVDTTTNPIDLDFCEAFNAFVGTPCDDNDPNTEDEWLEEGCKCVGQVINGCNAIITVRDNTIIVAGVNGARIKVHLYDRTFSNAINNDCDYWNDCEGTQTFENLLPGVYAVQYQSFNDDWTNIYCDSVVYVEIVAPTNQNDCQDIHIEIAGNNVMLDNFPTLNTIVDVYDPNFRSMFNCIGDCGTGQTVENLPVGDYLIRFKVYDAVWNFVCEREERIKIVAAIAADSEEREQSPSINLTTGRSAEIVVDKLTTYPNPTAESINVTMNSFMNEGVTITLTDRFGSVLQKHQLDKVNDAVFTMNIRGYAAGVYQVMAFGNGQFLTTKVIVLR